MGGRGLAKDPEPQRCIVCRRRRCGRGRRLLQYARHKPSYKMNAQGLICCLFRDCIRFREEVSGLREGGWWSVKLLLSRRFTQLVSAGQDVFIANDSW